MFLCEMWKVCAQTYHYTNSLLAAVSQGTYIFVGLLKMSVKSFAAAEA